MLVRSVTTVLLTVGPLAVALAQPVAVGPEFHVNTYTTTADGQGPPTSGDSGRG